MGIGVQTVYAKGNLDESRGIYDKEIGGGGWRFTDLAAPPSDRKVYMDYFDWNAGGYYRLESNGLNLEAGLSIYHIFHPQIAMLPPFDPETRLRARAVVFINLDTRIGDKSILMLRNIYWQQGLYWHSTSIDAYNITANWLGFELQRAAPKKYVYFNYGLYSRSFKTIMPYLNVCLGNKFSIRGSYEFPIVLNIANPLYSAKRAELSLQWVLNKNRKPWTPGQINKTIRW